MSDDEVNELILDLAAANSRADRAEAEVRSLTKKVERLSLMIIDLWLKVKDGRPED